MNSKEIILNRIAGAAMPPVDYPAFDFTPLRFEDRTAAFAEAVKAAGGQVVAADGNPLTELSCPKHTPLSTPTRWTTPGS